MAKISKKANKRTNTFLKLPHAVLDSSEYKSLKLHTRALLIDISSQYNGTNNGLLIATRSYLKSRGWTSHYMLSKCLNELIESKLLIVMRPPGKNRCALYALSWLSTEANI